MNYDIRSFVRRALHSVEVGEVRHVQRADIDRATLEAELKKIAEKRYHAFDIKKEGDGFLVTRLPDLPKGRYPFNTLTEIGASFFIEMDPKHMNSMRSAASRYMRANPGVFIRCSEETGGLRATRRAADDNTGRGRPHLPPERHKYPFTALEVGESVLICLPRTEHGKIRNSVSARASNTGCRYTCRAEADGLRVTRLA